MDRKKTAYGFSLTELLIVIAIVAILASITLPSYSSYVYKTRRADAVASLLQLQLAQEQWRATYGVYSIGLQELGWQNQSADNFYELAFETAQPGAWLATAKPVGVQAGDSCGLYAIDHQGPVFGGRFASHTCWNR